MKKTMLLLGLVAGLLVSVVSFSSCSKDDDPAPIDVEKVIGYWYCVSSTDNVDGEVVKGYMEGKWLNVQEDGTYTSNSTQMDHGTWTLTGNRITVKNSFMTITATVSLSGPILRLVGSTSEGTTFDYTFRNDVDLK